MRYDVIVIGAGLGGLTAGAKLAREGMKVLVIEQHSRPGGCATTFKRGEYTFEVGLHEMDGPGSRDVKNRIFSELDVTGNVEFLPVPEFYRFIRGDLAVTVPHDPQLAAERLTGMFPLEKEGIDRYFEHLLKPVRKPAAGSDPDITVGAFLDSIIKNDDLKLILLGNLGYFHDDPYSLSLAYYSIAQGSYYTNGASFIKGGSQRLSDHLAAYIIRHGGEVLLNHLVTRITVRGNRATGVTCRKRNDPAKSPIESTADEIVVNSAIPALTEILPHDYGELLREECGGLNTGASLLTVYFGFNRPLKELGHNYYSVFIYDTTVKSQADIASNNRDNFSRRSFTFVDYGQVDSGLASGANSVGAVCCIDYLSDWEHLGREEYERKKDYVAKTFIERLGKLIPGFEDAVGYYEVGTPLTVRRYTLNPGGAVYGFAQNPGKKTIDSFSPVDNLYFASAWGKTGGGFSGAITGGYLCAYTVLRKKARR
ncbi:MAG: NAD(P)/FAD-dependent oxidoreductase [Bacteroidales bacterium]|jgi:phytoene dehydrogenase-like protein|nr:NAD(P)/FAD-dependent oxidoreductase [Bacteroidales bacterium]